MNAINENEQLLLEADGGNATNQELAVLSEHPPLIESARPLIEKVADGLQGMSKIVGSATAMDEISLEVLAAASDVKAQCATKISHPLVELHQHVNTRRKVIVSMLQDQVKEVKVLQENLRKLKEGQSSIKEKLEIVSGNAESLAARSQSALQSASDLMPTITQSEHDYFRELERLDEKTQQWQTTLERLQRRESRFSDSVRDGSAGGHLSLPGPVAAQLKALSGGAGDILRNYSEKLGDLNHEVDRLGAIAGVDLNPHGEVGRMQ